MVQNTYANSWHSIEQNLSVPFRQNYFSNGARAKRLRKRLKKFPRNK